jgi:hypothetical protein
VLNRAPRQARQRCISSGQRLPRQRKREPQRLIEFIRLHSVAGVGGGQYETEIAVGRVESCDQPDGGYAMRRKIGVVGIGHKRQVRRERQTGARGGVLDPGIETFETGCQRGQSECAANTVEIDVANSPSITPLAHE